MSYFIERGKGSIFFQDDPAEAYEFLTCVGAGNITIPRRSRTIKYCPDPKRAGEFKAAGFIKGEAGAVTCSLVRPLDSVYNFLLQTECPFHLRINHPCRGDRTIVTNYDVAHLLYNSEFTSGEVGQPAIMEPGEDERVLTNAELSAWAHQLIYPLLGAKQEPDPAASTTGINDMAVLPEQCADRCGNAVGLGQVVWAALDSEAPAASAGAGDQVIYTEDYGATWDLTTTDPLTNGLRDALCILLMETGAGYRVLVGGSSRAGHPAQASYTDDYGANWTDVTVGTTNNEALNGFERDPLGRVWAVSSAGQIYYSTDQGASFTLALTMGAPQILYDIAFHSENVGYAVGATGTFLYTVDGGLIWTLGADPTGATDDVLTVDTNEAGYVFIGTSAGDLFRSGDYGDTWDTIRDNLGTAVNKVRFDPKLNYFGGLVHDAAGPLGRTFRSEDDGVTWQEQTYITNLGLDAFAFAGPNMFYTGGEPTATGESFIAHYQRAAS